MDKSLELNRLSDQLSQEFSLYECKIYDQLSEFERIINNICLDLNTKLRDIDFRVHSALSPYLILEMSMTMFLSDDEFSFLLSNLTKTEDYKKAKEEVM